MYISFHKQKGPDKADVVIHLMSNMPVAFPELIQMYLDECLDEHSELYDPGFPWDSADIHVLYHGLAEFPDQVALPLADGRVMQVVNINPGHANAVAAVLGDYVAVVEVGRQALLAGDTPVEAAYKLWNYCLEQGLMACMTEKGEYFLRVVEDMERLRRALIQDLSALSGGGIPS